MRHRKPDLIVPIRDRRQRRRLLTIRNTGYATLVVIVAFLVISVRSELRRGTPEGDYGRLYGQELPPPPTQAVEVVREATPAAVVDDHVSADPMLTAPAARAEFLETDATANASTLGATAEPLTLSATPRDGNARVAIVGGPEGVAAIGNAPSREARKLKGGIFRSE
jgi:hypothetical protein